MKLKRMVLENFRGFERLELDLDSQLTLLVGANGSGKSAVLDAVCVAVSPIVQYLGATDGARNIRGESEARRTEVVSPEGTEASWHLPVRISAIATRLEPHDSTGPHSEFLPEDHLCPENNRGYNPVEWEWCRELKKVGQRTTGPLPPAAKKYLNSLLTTGNRLVEDKPCPLFAYYGTNRLWNAARATEAKKGADHRIDGYIGTLNPVVNATVLTEWVGREELEGLKERRQMPRLAAVKNAVLTCVPGATDFGWAFGRGKNRRGTLYIDRAIEVESAQKAPSMRTTVRETFDLLSDGFRVTTALVADIARRCAILNIWAGSAAPTETPGVVLIDEIELHLHPRWQREILPSLLRAFPKLQFIVTTHSPQVLASVKREQVRILEDNKLVASSAFVQGRDSNGLLTDVFGVRERPESAQKTLDDLFSAIKDRQLERARTIYAELERQLGPFDELLATARWRLERLEQPIPSTTPVPGG